MLTLKELLSTGPQASRTRVVLPNPKGFPAYNSGPMDTGRLECSRAGMHEERCDRDTQAHMDPSHAPPAALWTLSCLSDLPSFWCLPHVGSSACTAVASVYRLRTFYMFLHVLHAMCQLSFYTFYILQ